MEQVAILTFKLIEMALMTTIHTDAEFIFLKNYKWLCHYKIGKQIVVIIIKLPNFWKWAPDTLATALSLKKNIR